MWEKYVFTDASGKIRLRPETYALPDVTIKGRLKSELGVADMIAASKASSSKSAPMLPSVGSVRPSLGTLSEAGEDSMRAKELLRKSESAKRLEAERRRQKEVRRREKLAAQRGTKDGEEVKPRDGRSEQLQAKIEEKLGKGVADRLKTAKPAPQELVIELSKMMNAQAPAAATTSSSSGTSSSFGSRCATSSSGSSTTSCTAASTPRRPPLPPAPGAARHRDGLLGGRQVGMARCRPPPPPPPPPLLDHRPRRRHHHLLLLSPPASPAPQPPSPPLPRPGTPSSSRWTKTAQAG